MFSAYCYLVMSSYLPWLATKLVKEIEPEGNQNDLPRIQRTSNWRFRSLAFVFYFTIWKCWNKSIPLRKNM